MRVKALPDEKLKRELIKRSIKFLIALTGCVTCQGFRQPAARYAFIFEPVRILRDAAFPRIGNSRRDSSKGWKKM